MKRRDCIMLLGGAVTWPLAARAQQKAVSVIGFLTASPGPLSPSVVAFKQGLGETGYVEGQNLAIEYRWAEGNYDRLPAMAADLVARKVDLILSWGGLDGTRAAKKARRTETRAAPSSP